MKLTLSLDTLLSVVNPIVPVYKVKNAGVSDPSILLSVKEGLVSAVAKSPLASALADFPSDAVVVSDASDDAVYPLSVKLIEQLATFQVSGASVDLTLEYGLVGTLDVSVVETFEDGSSRTSGIHRRVPTIRADVLDVVDLLRDPFDGVEALTDEERDSLAFLIEDVVPFVPVQLSPNSLAVVSVDPSRERATNVTVAPVSSRFSYDARIEALPAGGYSAQVLGLLGGILTANETVFLHSPASGRLLVSGSDVVYALTFTPNPQPLNNPLRDLEPVHIFALSRPAVSTLLSRFALLSSNVRAEQVSFKVEGGLLALRTEDYDSRLPLVSQDIRGDLAFSAPLQFLQSALVGGEQGYGDEYRVHMFEFNNGLYARVHDESGIWSLDFQVTPTVLQVGK